MTVRGPAVISFNRGYWCPFLQDPAQSYRRASCRAGGRGREVVSIIPDRQQFAEPLRTLTFDRSAHPDRRRQRLCFCRSASLTLARRARHGADARPRSPCRGAIMAVTDGSCPCRRRSWSVRTNASLHVMSMRSFAGAWRSTRSWLRSGRRASGRLSP